MLLFIFKNDFYRHLLPGMLVLGLVLGLVLCLSTKNQVLVLVLGLEGRVLVLVLGLAG